MLSVPVPLRYWMASNKTLTAKVHRILASVIEEFYTSGQAMRSGSIAFVQRFGSALNLNVHFHILQIEGAYLEKTTGKHKFIRKRTPTNKDIGDLLMKISTEVISLLQKLEYLGDPQEEYLSKDLFDEEATLADCMAASVKMEIAFGPRRGQKVRFLGSGFGYEGESPKLNGDLCTSMNGFSLHAASSISRHRRDRLEQLIRYAARPSLATERMSLSVSGEVKYQLKSQWKNGRTHVVLSPMELIEKLCSLIPLPYMHLVRYWGVFASNSRLRRGVIPGKTRAEIREECEQSRGGEVKKGGGSWAKLLARVFKIDVSTCLDCGGQMRVIAQIMRVDVIQEILVHCGFAPRPPPIAEARSEGLYES